MINDIIEDREREKLVRDLGVFELRGLARELGVPSPTTKKREELISLILDAIKDGNSIDKNTQKRGRPFKKLNALEDIVNKMICENKDCKFETFDYHTLINFNQDTFPVFAVAGNESYELEGVIRLYQGRLFFKDCNNNSTVYLDEDLYGYEYLEEGALVKIFTNEINNDNSFKANKILEINGVSFDQYNHVVSQNSEEIIDNNVMPFADGLVKVGRRNVFSFNEDLYENDNYIKFYNYCKENDYKFITVSVNSSYENMIMFKNNDIDGKFISEYGANSVSNFDKIVDAVAFAKYLTTKGNKVVIFISDIIEVLRCFDNLFGNEENSIGHSQKVLLLIQNLLSSGRSYKNGSNLSLVMGYSENDKEDAFLNQDILKISKKIN